MSLGAKVSGRGVSGTTSMSIFNSIAPNTILQLTHNEFTDTSEIKISCVVQEKHGEEALQSLHRAFGLDKTGD